MFITCMSSFPCLIDVARFEMKAQLESELKKAMDFEKLQKESEEKALELEKALRHCRGSTQKELETL